MPSGQFENTAAKGTEIELSPSQILERVKPDHVTVTKPEEDRRRRTIIVEKKNGSYGFTLQSYGIHYRKEQEIEMITYVDHIDYDGPAFRAGMREGDVILSINGHDMERADHKSLVNFIKSCDGRMRMVVLFENCVRKVELHMRYIHLQRRLQKKTAELEKLCLQEKELLSGKWKTHSLPARKKASSSKTTDGTKVPTDSESAYIARSAASSENVANIHYPKNTRHFLIHYPCQPYYVDTRGRSYYLHPANTPISSKEYLVTIHNGDHTPKQRSNSQCSSHSRRSSMYGKSSESIPEDVRRRSNYQQEGVAYSKKHGNVSVVNIGPDEPKGNCDQSKCKDRRVSRSRSYHQHICAACISTSPKDNNSLEAYDLASSPCCNSQCVPIRRRRSRSQHQHKLKPSSSKTSLQTQTSSVVTTKELSESYNNRSTQATPPGNGMIYRHPSKYIRKYYPACTNLSSQHSLHSCISSELGPVQRPTDNSVASYTTSLSSDTLYWDHPPDIHDNKTSVRSSPSCFHDCQEYVKPVKSWDSLITKACGGHGFSYEYVDKSRIRNISTKHVEHKRNTGRSSESLFYTPNLSNASLSYEYLNASSSPMFVNEKGSFLKVTCNNTGVLTNQKDKASQTDVSKRLVNVQQTPEVTRL